MMRRARWLSLFLCTVLIVVAGCNKTGTLPAAPASKHIYVVDDKGLTALRASDGKELWNVGSGGYIFPTSDVVYVSVGLSPIGTPTTIEALRASDGAVLWTHDTTGQGVAVGGGIIAVEIGDPQTPNSLTALNMNDGSVRWTARVADFDLRDLTIGPDAVYVYGDKTKSQSNEAMLFALRLKDGKLLWKAPTGFTVETITPVVANGVVYMADMDGNVSARKVADGSLLWRVKPQTTSQFPSPTLTVDQHAVYVGAVLGGYVAALNPSDGSVLWQQSTAIASSLAIADGVVYGEFEFANDDKGLAALDARTGAVRWRTHDLWGVALANFEAPAVLNDAVYSGGDTGPGSSYVYGVRASDGAVVWRVDASNLISITAG